MSFHFPCNPSVKTGSIQDWLEKSKNCLSWVACRDSQVSGHLGQPGLQFFKEFALAIQIRTLIIFPCARMQAPCGLCLHRVYIVVPHVFVHAHGLICMYTYPCPYIHMSVCNSCTLTKSLIRSMEEPAAAAKPAGSQDLHLGNFWEHPIPSSMQHSYAGASWAHRVRLGLNICASWPWLGIAGNHFILLPTTCTSIRCDLQSACNP